MTLICYQWAVPLDYQLAAARKAAHFDGIQLSSVGGAAAVSVSARATPPAFDGISLSSVGGANTCQHAATHNAARFDGIHLSSVGGAAAVSKPPCVTPPASDDIDLLSVGGAAGINVRRITRNRRDRRSWPHWGYRRSAASVSKSCSGLLHGQSAIRSRSMATKP